MKRSNFTSFFYDFWYNDIGDNMKKIFKILYYLVIIGILVFCFCNKELIQSKIGYIYDKYFTPTIRQDLNDSEYRKKENYEYLKIDESIEITNKEQIKDILYTFLDAGWKEYKVKCSVDYETCITDVKQIVGNTAFLTQLSNFIHPYNTFKKINTSISSNGIITLSRIPKYSEKDIKELNNKVDKIYKENYDSSKNIKDNIKIFHDYIVNNTKYDSNYDKNNNISVVGTAYGVLINGSGICSGYSEAMQLFLEKLGVKNYRISTSTHEWNIVNVEGNWLHMDVTWDDPETTDGRNILNHNYFLISSDELHNNDNTDHNYDEKIYLEAK